MVNFTIDLNDWEYPNADYDQCGLNGSWNAEGENWLGWGLTLTDDDEDGVFQGSLEGLAIGSYEYIVFCSGVADNYSGWGVSLGAPLGSECDGDPSDEFPNYGFTVGENDLDINVLKGKQLTNVRASGTDEAVNLMPPKKMSLEQMIAYIKDDELLEVTPKSLRLRKKLLIPHERKRAS